MSVSTLTGNVLLHFDPATPLVEIIVRVTAIVAGLPESSHKRTSLATPHAMARSARNGRMPSKRKKRIANSGNTRLTTFNAERWHRIAAVDLLEQFGTSSLKGLSRVAATNALARYGANVLPEITPRSSWEIFFDQFRSLPVALLGASACLSLVTGGSVDAVVITAVVFINAAIGFATETQAERAISSLIRIPAQPARVVRDGTTMEIPSAEIVPGDILTLLPGASVPADARVIEAEHLSVDESSLTGESLPAVKTVSVLAKDNVPLAERANMVYRGTTVTGGSGSAVTVATGQNTEFGKIQTLLGATHLPDTPLEKQLSALGNRLVMLSLPICGAMFTIGLLRGYGLTSMFKTTVALGVAAVPEGLPTVATTTLALGLEEMHRRKVLIRHLDAVEALGSVQVMCLDKTGTLTANRMTVVAMQADKGYWRADNGWVSLNAEAAESSIPEDLKAMVSVAVLCNDSEISEHSATLRGSPTENALVILALDLGIDVLALRTQFPRSRTTYRTETLQLMSTVHDGLNGHLIAVKGNPGEVLRLCRWRAEDTHIVPLGEEQRNEIMARNEGMAANGLRVLGFACKTADEAGGDIGDLIWLGLVGMTDPIRDAVPSVIEEFHQAGIATVMITGDQSATATAVGRELRLSGDRPLNVLDASRLDQIDPELLHALAPNVHVFARVSPAQKLKIVQALQRAGKVVAMTGDGINDGPALKMADVGVALGLSGTEVARRVADIVLEDDDLAAMIGAVSQGRTIYDNIRKSIRFLLATNLSEVGLMLSSIALGLGQPLSPIQLLWINLITDIFPGLALALEPAQPDVLRHRPRDPDVPIVTSADFKRLSMEAAALTGGALAAYVYGLARYGPGTRASGVTFMTLTSAQLLHTLACRSERHGLFGGERLAPNGYLNTAIGASFAAQALAGFFPSLRRLLNVAPLNALDLTVVGAGAIFPLLVNEGAKSLRSRVERDRFTPSAARVP